MFRAYLSPAPAVRSQRVRFHPTDTPADRGARLLAGALLLSWGSAPLPAGCRHVRGSGAVSVHARRVFDAVGSGFEVFVLDHRDAVPCCRQLDGVVRSPAALLDVADAVLAAAGGAQ